MQGLHVGDVADVGDAIYDEFCDKTGAAREEGEGRTTVGGVTSAS